MTGKVGWALTVLVCATAPIVNRLMLLGGKGVNPSMVDARGVFADLSVAISTLLLVAGLLSLRRVWARVAALLLLLALVFVNFAMFEFISAFDSLHALSHVRFLADSTFLGGSAVHMQHPVVFVAMIASSILAIALADIPTGSGWWLGLGLALAASVFGQLVIPVSDAHDEWRQRHALQTNLFATRDSGAEDIGPTMSEVHDAFRSDLEGKRWIGPIQNRPNVILIMVEGASGAYLPSIAAAAEIDDETKMPKLDAVAQDHVLFSRVVSHQRQTNRGEYSILCGDYPKLVTDQSKMTEQVYGTARFCLPQLFKDAGYATVYIQSAPLGFMLKDQFMRKIGFDELIGDPWFRHSYARTDWGVDDKAFFEQALLPVLELHQGEQPFFATLLTVGTHHPYTFPKSYAPADVSSQKAKAFRWADDALADFLGQLDRAGVLDDTIVVVTSDESAGTSRATTRAQRLLSQSWSFAVVLLPERQAKRIDDLYGHIDLALSLADLLGLGDRASTFIGRSMFRRYDAPRRLFGGNTYARKVFMWEPTGSAVYCDEDFRACKHATSDVAFGSVTSTETPRATNQKLLAEVARLTRSGRPDMTASSGIALLSDAAVRIPAQDGKKLLIGGQYLRVPAQSVVRVDFDLEVLGEPAETMDLHQDVFLNGHPAFERKGMRLHGGDRWRLSYSFGVPTDSSHLVVQLYARTVAGEALTIRFHDATLSMLRKPGESKEPTIIRDEVTRSHPR